MHKKWIVDEVVSSSLQEHLNSLEERGWTAAHLIPYDCDYYHVASFKKTPEQIKPQSKPTVSTRRKIDNRTKKKK